MSDKKYDISRRKALLGLGTIGVASAGAGAGTSAFFSDEEDFTDNNLTAGKLNLIVDYYTDRNSASNKSNTGSVDGRKSEKKYSYVLDDVKPGDSGTLVFCPKIVDNDGWLWIGSEDGVTDFENARTEPELGVDGTGGVPGEGNGELSEAIQVTVSYCDIDDVSEGFDEEDKIREFNNPADYTLADLFKELESGFLLDGQDVDDGSTDPYPSSPNQAVQKGPCLCIEWEVPTDIGNEIQTDSVEFDFGFSAVQRRNNPTPANPFVDITVGQGSEFDYSSIQTAVDVADSGDVISVASKSETSYPEQVIGTEGVTLVAARGETPTIDGPGASDKNSPAISIEADGVTVDGFEVTNPEGLLGIKVENDENDENGDGYDDINICNNRIFNVGPTGNLGVTGIIVGQEDHNNIRIVDNTIENLTQTGSSGTVNGILFDANNSNPATIANVTVGRNTIRVLESEYAPLGIVVQQNVENLSIKSNNILDLTATGTGSNTTFAQGISIDSPTTIGFKIFGNTIKNIVSEDGFFAEDIKIESVVEVSGIDIYENNLLSAIGLNNANGNNPDVRAEDNYWNSSNGPIVIENNDDDGDVPTPSGGTVDLDTKTASAVTENVDYVPFATSQQ